MLFGYILALLASFYLLARVCDAYFVESLDKIAGKMKLSSDMAGATLMAVGTSAPELFVSLIAILKPGGHEAIGAGTIVGSAIFNILVIIGASAIIRKAVITWQPVLRDTLFYSISIIMLIVVFRDGVISLHEASMFLVVYVIYIFAVINWKKILPYKDMIRTIEKEMKDDEKSQWRKLTRPIDNALDKLFPSPGHYYSIFFISIAIIIALSWVLVESAIGIAQILQVSEAIIGLTILAAGTSVPDLLSSVIVARQGRSDMAVSNAIGSNIFDILFGLGMPWFLVLIISGKVIPVNNENLLSSIFLLLATVIAVFFLLFLRKWKIGRRSGFALILLYAAYLIWAVSRL